MKSLNLFDYLKNIAYKNEKLEVDSSFSKYMISRYLSFQHPTFALMMEKLNRDWSGVSNQMFYDMVYHTIPKHGINFQKYVKKQSVRKKPQHKVVETIARDLQISQREVIEYLEVFPDLKKEWEKMGRVKATKK